MADDKKQLHVSEQRITNKNWRSLWCLVLILVLEAVALAIITTWQNQSVEYFSRKVEQGNRLLLELEGACARKEGKEAEVRAKRQTLSDLFQDMLQSQKQVFQTLCLQHPDLCKFGPKGDTGDVGDIGTPGLKGPKGEAGTVGPRGQKSQRGPQGDHGIPGAAGPQGANGRTGPQGPTGQKGSSGLRGSQGNKGPAGPDGQKVTLGEKGDPGLRGPRGPKGATGESGPKGLTGDEGPRGERGDAGLPGPKGPLLGGNCVCVEVPTISGNFSDVENVRLHQSLTLHCDASDSQAKVTWRRTDRKSFTGSVSSSRSDIVFTSVTPAEEGVYECMARSAFGDVTKTVEVKLLAPSVYDCDFEQDLCRWTNRAGDRFDWTRYKGPTSSAGTGPTVDHTLETSEGHYLYIETSGSRLNGDNARLESMPLEPSQGYCLSFWYHLYGSSIGNINVRIQKSGLTEPPMWTRSGPSEDRWQHALLDIPPQITPFSVIIEGIRGTSYKGDAAIDDISVHESTCESVSVSLIG